MAVQIAGNLTDQDWKRVSAQLPTASARAWEQAVNDFFVQRLDLRYLRPIHILLTNDAWEGQGFSIMAIQCSLIEFLESTAQGTFYCYKKQGPALGPHEYSSSKKVFTEFLTNRAPFSQSFDTQSALDFYVSIRCGLLHEASTKNGWRIWANGPSGIVADTHQKIAYRNNFQRALLEYVGAYRERVKTDQDLQAAFIRKFNNLCS